MLIYAANRHILYGIAQIIEIQVKHITGLLLGFIMRNTQAETGNLGALLSCVVSLTALPVSISLASNITVISATEGAGGTKYQDSAATRNQVHTFVNAEWKPTKKLALNFGAMLEKYEGFSGLFSPRVAMNYSLNENHTFRIAHSRAYRVPNVWEEQVDSLFYTDVHGAVPGETYGILASHRFDNGIQVISGFYHTGKITWLDPEDTTDSFNKWGLRVAEKFDLQDTTIDVAAITHNITDNHYQEYYEGNQAQREFHLQAGVNSRDYSW
jgi:hypothetical protein